MKSSRAMKSRTPIITAPHVIKVPKNFLIFRSLQLSLAVLVLSLSIYGIVIMTNPITGVILSLVTVSSWRPRSSVATAHRRCSHSAQSLLQPIHLSLLTEISQESITTGLSSYWNPSSLSSGYSLSLTYRFLLAKPFTF